MVQRCYMQDAVRDYAPKLREIETYCMNSFGKIRYLT